MSHVIVEFFLVCKLTESELAKVIELSEFGEETIGEPHVCSVVGRSELDSYGVEIETHKEVEAANEAPEIVEKSLTSEERFHGINDVFFDLIAVFEDTYHW